MANEIDGLRDCPYSLPDEADVEARLRQLRTAELTIRQKIQTAAVRLSQERVIGQVYEGQRARELFESNSIEGLGPSLPDTFSILRSPVAREVRVTVEKLHDRMFIESIQKDRHLVEVLGIHGAKVLAEELLGNWKSGRAISEADIRSMHSLIAAGESYAGRYKRYHVAISGSSHEPVLPVDTPGAMHVYAEWLNDSRPGLPALLAAAVAHAWLVHIHPFEDGNGRLARIVTNLLLAREDLPPVIIMHNSERASYIDALGHSDVAGDIMPLTGLFANSTKRFAREIGKPSYLRQLLRDEVAQANSGVFEIWRSALDIFLERLFGELRLRNIDVSIADLERLDSQSFGLLIDRNASGSTWLFKLYENTVELLVWLGFSSSAVDSHVENLTRYPSLFFSVRTGHYDLKPYRLAYRHEVGGLQEVCVIPDRPPIVYTVSGGRLRRGGVRDSASEIADRIRNGFQARREPEE